MSGAKIPKRLEVDHHPNYNLELPKTLEGKRLDELLGYLTKTQAEFLNYRLVGIPERMASTLVGVKKGTPEQHWRHQDKFRDIESCVLANGERYRPEAQSDFRDLLLAKTYVVFNNILETGFKWKELGNAERTIVLKVGEAVIRMQGKKDGAHPLAGDSGRGDGYEDRIFRDRAKSKKGG